MSIPGYKDPTPERQLLSAIHNKDVGQVRALLENGANARADAGARKKNKLEALHIASQTNQPEVIELLITHGADVNAISSINSSPLQYAIINRAEAAFDTLMAHGADPLLPDSFRIPALCNAVSSSSKHIYTCLLPLFDDLDAPDQNGATALLRMAKQKGWEDEFVDLHRRGANLTAKSNLGDTALHIAGLHNVHGITTYVLEHAPGLLLARNSRGETPLHAAISHTKRCRSLDLMLETLPISQMPEGLAEDLLFHAVTKQNAHATETLLKNGVSIHARNADGLTPIEAACAGGKAGAVPALLKYGASLYNGPGDKPPIELARFQDFKDDLREMHNDHVTERTKRISRTRRNPQTP